MKHFYTVLAIIIFSLLFIASSVQKISTQSVSYEKVERKLPYDTIIKYNLPLMKMASHTEQKQIKGGAEITCRVEQYSMVKRSPIIDKRPFYRNPQMPKYDVFEIRNVPNITSNPEFVTFEILVKNKTDRVMKLRDVPVVLIIDGVQFSIETKIKEHWENSMIIQGFDKSLTVLGPKVSDLNMAKVIYLAINDVPTSYDSAGNVTKKDNFEWYFTCELEEHKTTEVVTYDYVNEIAPNKICENCNGSKFLNTICNTCGGSGHNALSNLATCTTCKGKGNINVKCPHCSGEGAKYFPTTELPAISGSINWSGWRVKISTNPSSLPLSFVNPETGLYDKSFSINANTLKYLNYYYSDGVDIYPIKVKYNNREYEFFPKRKKGRPTSFVKIDFSSASKPKIKGGVFK